MLTARISLDPASKEVVNNRTFNLGEQVPVVVILENDAAAAAPVRLDTILMEIVFNDDGPVLHIDPQACPVAGELAAIPGTTDSISGAPVAAGAPKDTQHPFSNGSVLTLTLPSHLLGLGPFKGITGQAGFQNLTTPFEVKPGAVVSSAAGKASTGIPTTAKGTTRIMARVRAYLNGQPVFVTSVPSCVTVQ